MTRFAAHGDSFKDPRIFENPIEASIELADVTEQRLPGLKRRNSQLTWFAGIWTVVVIVLALLVGALALTMVLDESWDLYSILVLFSAAVLLVPSTGLGMALMILAFQEKMFLPYLEQASRAVVAMGGPPSHSDAMAGMPEGETSDSERDEMAEERRLPGGSIGGILGSAMWVGDLVPVAGRLTAIGRYVLAVILAGLTYLVAIAVIGLVTGLVFTYQLVAEIIVFAVFVSPAVLLFQALTRDLEFYQYYSRRHGALAEVSALGIPPVPEGKDHQERYGRFLRSLPYVDAMLRSPQGGVEKEPGRKGYHFSRLYHGMLGEEHVGILVKVFDKMPDREDLDLLLEEARTFGQKRGFVISRAVALVAADVDDVDDRLYDHIVELGRRTRPGDCALQLVMEVEGTYSMVPYVSV